ncbi:unnamed protein product [Trichobilharzia regenti]|nr:unnamed protein product [Trichobilharzia regenti]
MKPSESGRAGVFSKQVCRVRWFYREGNNKRWVSFNGSDSINLEFTYRSHQASCKSCHNSASRTPTSCEPKQYCTKPKVSVRGGLYEANVIERRCVPVYWSDDKCPTSILRGTWFREGYSGTLEPLDDESMAERLEAEYNTWYLKTYQSPRKSMCSKNDMFAKSHSGSLLHSVLSAPVLHSPDTIESVSETFIQTPESSFCENFPSVNGSDLDDNSSAPTALKKRVLGTRLFRGFTEQASAEDKLPDISHLCFVVHGIGQKMGTNPILKNCNE